MFNSTTLNKNMTKHRDFNLISNNYYENNRDRKIEEFNRMKEHVLNKYWETHNYDFLKGEYYNYEKEKDFHKQRELLEDVRGTMSKKMIPPGYHNFCCIVYCFICIVILFTTKIIDTIFILYYCHKCVFVVMNYLFFIRIQCAEGRSYNILNHSVYDDDHLKVVMNMSNRSLGRVKGLEMERKAKEDGDKEAQKKEELKMNRISFKRWERQVDRGYDPVKNVVYEESTSPFPLRPQTMWARLSTDSHSPENKKNNNPLRTSMFGDAPSLQTRNLSGSSFGASRPLSSTEALSSHRSSADNLQPPLSNRQGYQSARSNRGERSNRIDQLNTSVSSARGLLTLDLSKAEQPEKVVYKEPSSGSLGMNVPIVRTGGLSSYRD